MRNPIRLLIPAGMLVLGIVIGRATAPAPGSGQVERQPAREATAAAQPPEGPVSRKVTDSQMPLVPAAPAPAITPAPAFKPIIPEEAIRQLAEARAITDLSMKRIRTASVLRHLASSGYLAEALALADEGAGDMRAYQLELILEVGEGNFQERVNAVRGFADDRDQAAGLRGLMNSLMGEEDALKFDLSTIASHGDPIRRKAATALAGRLSVNLLYLQEARPEGYRETSQRVVDRVLDLATGKEIGAREVSLAFDRMAEQLSSFKMWDYLAQVDRDAADTYRAELDERVISRMVSADSGRAMEMLVAGADGAGADTAIGLWYQRDPGGANEWLAANITALPPGPKDRILETVIDLALKENNPAAARSWAERLSDPGRRAELLGE